MEAKSGKHQVLKGAGHLRGTALELPQSFGDLAHEVPCCEIARLPSFSEERKTFLPVTTEQLFQITAQKKQIKLTPSPASHDLDPCQFPNLLNQAQVN